MGTLQKRKIRDNLYRLEAVVDEFVCFSDIQFQWNYNKSFITERGFTSWFMEQLRIVEEIFDYCTRNEICTVIFNGDMFQNKSNISTSIYNEVWELFHNYNWDLDIILNTGNHDIYSENISSLKPFSTITNVISEPTDIYGESVFARIIPYGMTSGNLSPPQLDDSIKILFVHENIAGLKVGVNDYVIGSPLKQQLFSEWDYVLAGHIHKPQETKNIINIGSPMIQDWSEAGDKKRFLHYKEGKWISIPIDCPDFVMLHEINDEVRELVENNNRDLFRIDIESSFIGDPIFKKWNVFYNIVKSNKRKSRLEKSEDIREELRKYVELKGTSLDKQKLLDYGFKFVKKGDSSDNDDTIGK